MDVPGLIHLFSAKNVFTSVFNRAQPVLMSKKAIFSTSISSMCSSMYACEL